MAMTPMDVKKSVPAATATPDLWRSFRTEMDGLFDRFADDFGLPSLSRMFDVRPTLRLATSLTPPTPAMDLTEDVDAYKLTAELPGMTEKDIEVVVTDGTLTLKGEKKKETERKDKNYYMAERAYGSFERSFTLPEGVDREKVGAEFAKGVLTITMPKKPEAKVEPTKIEVKAAA